MDYPVLYKYKYSVAPYCGLKFKFNVEAFFHPDKFSYLRATVQSIIIIALPI